MAPGPKRRGPKRGSNQQAVTAATNVADSRNARNQHPSEDQTSFQSETNIKDRTRTDEKSLSLETENNEGNESKRYAKRNIRSNWDRYSEEPSENQQSSHPADFQTLLNSSGGIGSQFSFQEEKEWAEVIKDSKHDDVLALDADDLANAIQCIPLHIRLRVDKNMFTDDMITHFEDVARIHKENYTGVRKWPFLNFDVEGKETSWPELKEKRITKNAVPVSAVVKEQQLNQSIHTKDVISSLVTSLSIQETKSATNLQKEDLLGNSNNSKKDELDFLLSLGSVPQPKKPIIDIGKECNPQESEKTATSNMFKQSDAKPDSSLDEWLDSVLES